MIDIDAWLRDLDDQEDMARKNNEEYQKKLFAECVMRGTDHPEKRR